MHVPEHVIEATWRAVGTLDPAGMRRLQRSSGKHQQEMMAFVIAWNSDQRREVLELALYLALVVLESFRRGPVRKIKRVSEARILRLLKANQVLLAELSDSPEEGGATLTDPETVTEPAVMEYVLSALVEASEDPEEPMKLTNEEFWHLVLVLKTFADALHEASRFDSPGQAL